MHASDAMGTPAATAPAWLQTLLDSTRDLLHQEQELSHQLGRLPEAIAGLTAQLQALEQIAALSSWEWAAWNQLRDAFSLHPANPGFEAAFRSLAQGWRGGSTLLEQASSPRAVVLHLSCQPRLERALASVRSFGDPCDGAPLHVVVVGGSQRVRLTGLAHAAGWLLELPSPDHYEHLHDKLFTAVALLWLWVAPPQLVKLDDDLHLGDPATWEHTLEALRTDGVAYAGRAVRAHHRDLRHGWHLNKCHDQRCEQWGYQYPLPRCFAAGGSGYVLGDAALAELAYAHLAMRQFFCMPCVGLEDGLVGLILQTAGISLHALDAPVLPGLSSS